MRTHQFIQFIDGDTFRMLTHQTEDRLDGTVLLGEFTTVRHDSSFSPPFFSRYLEGGHVAWSPLPGHYRLRISGAVAFIDRFEQLISKAVNLVLPN